METEPDGRYVEVAELGAREGRWAFVVWLAEVALVGKHLFTREALSLGTVSEHAPEYWGPSHFLLCGLTWFWARVL